MDIRTFWEKYKKPHEQQVKELDEEQKQLGQLYRLINDPAWKQIETWFFDLKDEGRIDQDKHTDKSIFTIWMFLKKIWQGRQKIEDANRFFQWIESIPKQLQIVSDELNRLTKP